MREDLYAQKGEKVCCTKGHIICEIGEDIYIGHFFKSSHLVKWAQDEPTIGKPLESVVCLQCGSRFIASSGMTLHFTNGWRTKNSALKTKLEAQDRTVNPRKAKDDGRIK